jgi:hypothetical protein
LRVRRVGLRSLQYLPGLSDLSFLGAAMLDDTEQECDV